MDLLKDGRCSKVIVLVLVIIAVVSPPDQCEAAKCYQSSCIDKCDDSQAQIENNCTQNPFCYYAKYLISGQTQITRGCNTVSKCLGDKFQFGKGLGCKEAPGEQLKVCHPSACDDGDHVKWCTCDDDLCNVEALLETDNGGGSGGGGDSGGDTGRGSSLKWTATGAGLMMISILCVAGVGGVLNY